MAKSKSTAKVTKKRRKKVVIRPATKLKPELQPGLGVQPKSATKLGPKIQQELKDKSKPENQPEPGIPPRPKKKYNLKQVLKKTWWFIWEDDSVLSWIVNVILAFVLIKFIVYPGLGLIVGTNYPIVAVISGSMEHDGSFDNWWESPAACQQELCTQEKFYNLYGISKSEFEEFKFNHGFNKGDIIFLRNVKDSEIGDVLVFMSPYKPEPIIHRIIKISVEDNGKIYLTKGDHNLATGKYDENIQEKQI